MKIFQVHNWHRLRSGSDVMAETTARILSSRNHDVVFVTRDSNELGTGIWGRIRAFASAIYCLSGRKLLAEAIREHRPDIIHLHEIYPFISPWALIDCRAAGVPVIMTCHDYRLSCPIHTHWSKHAPCRRCLPGEEFWCMLKNCRGNIAESTAYALRSAIARRLKLIKDNITRYIAPSAFLKRTMVAAQFPAGSIDVVPNMVDACETPSHSGMGTYVGYAGRITIDKGIGTLIESAKKTKLPVRAAGDCSPIEHLMRETPSNVTFTGLLPGKQLDEFYRDARFLVVPSLWDEPFGLVIAEAMMRGKAVIAADSGGIPELVDDGKTGLLFQAGNSEELSGKMEWLWKHANECGNMGLAGREKAVREYNEEIHYHRLMDVYRASLDE